MQPFCGSWLVKIFGVKYFTALFGPLTQLADVQFMSQSRAGSFKQAICIAFVFFFVVLFRYLGLYALKMAPLTVGFYVAPFETIVK